MPDHVEKTIESIVRHNLCAGCGTCVAVCARRAISMTEKFPGILIPRISEDSCNACGICFDICPRNKLLNPELLEECGDPLRGPVIKAFLGHANDPLVRRGGQSGGIATALLIHQLRTGRIDCALTSRMPDDGLLRPGSYLTSSCSELLTSQGSLYCPIAVNEELANVEKDVRIGVVALPCHVQGMWNMKAKYATWQKTLPLIIGLFCDRTLNFAAMDYLVSKANVNRRDVRRIAFRDKSGGAFPENVAVALNDGKTVVLPNRYRTACKDFFTPVHCRLCHDKMGTLSDIAVGDAWGMREAGAGYSVILARSDAGMEAMLGAMRDGYIECREIDPEKIFAGQNVSKKRADIAAFARAWGSRGRPVPETITKLRLSDMPVSGSDVRSAEKKLSWAEESGLEQDVDVLIRKAGGRISHKKMLEIIGRFAPARLTASLKRSLPVFRHISKH
jgi:coenzyme F420 hydrogenase subunit beta